MMERRSRSTVSNSMLTTFHPFKRLPIELRFMIWRLTLEPRVVEVEHGWRIGNSRNEDEDCYYSRINLPIALNVCHDSRDAIIPLYPLCFAADSSRPMIRFNFSLDTLYIDDTFGEYVFDFLENLKPIEMARLKLIAISDKVGYDLHDTDKKGHAYWARLGGCIERLSGLKTILTVHHLPSILRGQYNAALKQGQHARAELWYRISVDYSSTKDRGMHLFEDIPCQVAQRLCQRLHLKAEEMPVAGNGSVHRGRGDWVDKRTKPVFGWD